MDSVAFKEYLYGKDLIIENIFKKLEGDWAKAFKAIITYDIEIFFNGRPAWKRKKIIPDVGTGSDDAIAIAAAVLCEDIEVVGICTASGNVEVKNTTDNTLRVPEC